MKMMRFFIFAMIVAVFFACTGNQKDESSTKDSTEATSSSNPGLETTTGEQVAKVGCAKCQLGLECDECQLGVKIGEEAYFVEGIDMNAFAEDDLCSMVKNAKVAGKVDKKNI